MADHGSKPLTKPDYHNTPLTVAGIHETEDGKTDVLFHETPQVMSVSHKLKTKYEQLEKLVEAKENDDPVMVRRHSHKGSVSHVKNMTEQEKEDFKLKRLTLPNPGRLKKIDVGSIDPTTFNFVGESLKAKAFLDSDKIVPNYKTAKRIFDFCKSQCCKVSQNTAFKPCIPFQYLEDGCYARAHKIRQIIQTKYNYSCEKAFCYAMNQPDYLSVRADLWGGCCIKFWYHVAPLVRVRVDTQKTVAMIFDPAVFERPVFMTSWMMGLENGGCYDHARISDYCIQPGDAYAPMADGQYLMDPRYKETDELLKKYAKLHSCGKNVKQVKVSRSVAKKPK